MSKKSSSLTNDGGGGGGVLDRLLDMAKSDPMTFGAGMIALIGFAVLNPISFASTVVGVALMGGFFSIYNTAKRRKSDNSKNNNNMRTTTTDNNKNTSKKATTTTTRLKNVWETSKSGAGSGNLKKAHEDKPFGSKYYYAHNNPNTTGGYKDGLKMEDYTMNGPRLLSRGGSKASSDVAVSSSSEQQQQQQPVVEEAVTETTKKVITTHDPNVMFITKYLWDDPGSSNGIATIRVDTLPEKNSSGKMTAIEWKDVNVGHVTADLMGEGLLVKVETTGPEPRKYQLKIAKLYGDAAEVKAVIKPKRLMIKIYKKKTAILSARGGDKSNLDAWPQPFRKI